MLADMEDGIEMLSRPSILATFPTFQHTYSGGAYGAYAVILTNG
jgi:hypothetical protein